jgi:hypothetical protein
VVQQRRARLVQVGLQDPADHQLVIPDRDQ